MAQSGYTPILIYASSTPGALPSAANLTSSASGAELAINYADGKLYFKNSSGVVTLLAGSSSGPAGGSNTQVQYNSSGVLAGSSNLTFDGTSLTLGGNPTLSAGTANGVPYLNGSKVLTSGSALTFDGVTNKLGFQNAAANGYAYLQNAGAGTNTDLAFFMGASEAMRLTSTGLVINDSARIGSARFSMQVNASTENAIAFKTSTNGEISALRGLNSAGSETVALNYDTTNSALYFRTANTQRMTLDSSGNLGLGVTPSAWSSYKGLQITGDSSFVSFAQSAEIWANGYYNGTNSLYISNGYASRYQQTVGKHIWFNAPSGTAGNAITFTEAMTLSAAGGLSIGNTGDAGQGNISVGGTGANFVNIRSASGSGQCLIFTESNVADRWLLGSPAGSGDLVFRSNAYNFSTGTERARITSGGALLVGTTNDNPVTSNAAGIALSGAGIKGLIIATVDGGDIIAINRKTDDGNLVTFHQDGTLEGTISVSGNTVSYNAFAGSHWSQLQDGSKPDILRGTVMESINELCVWPGEQNERLPKSKISDTAGSKKVYGVFMTWDNDWTATNDMYVTAVGAFICRVNGGVTVQEGDLLESNGDGTARVQADDIIRSSTIGKVTSTVKTHEYDDGSYCVPTVLYCG